MTRRVACVAGVRPNFMKVAAVLRALRGHDALEGVLVHTGQHYDAGMSDAFLRDLGLPEPAVHLRVGADRPARQMARIMEGFEAALAALAPDAVVVVGDASSTLACALAAAQGRVPVAHVEAGLRSFDRAMPEEINRILTDHLADALFVTERSGIENLRREGVPDGRVHLVGNTMIDTLVRLRPRIEAEGAARRLGLEPGGYALVTLHRPSNVDDGARLAALADMLGALAAALPVVFPVHPRTRAALERAGLAARLAGAPGVRLLDPQPYLAFLSLVTDSRLVLTDSGGIQEETTFLGVPCVTARASTERPVTVETGTNVLAGEDPARVLAAAGEVLAGRARRGGTPPLWDGHAAERIAAELARWLA